MSKKQFLVIGVGRFGTSIAKTLYSLGHDVLAIDKNPEAISDISDYVTHAAQIDATEEKELNTIGIKNFDVTIIAVGEDIQSSIMITLLAKELGSKYVVAKGISELHAKVLKKIGADKVVLPERDMGIRLAKNLVSSNILDYITLSSEYGIVEIKVSNKWQNKTLLELNLRSKYEVNVVAIERDNKVKLNPLGEEKLYKDDILIAIGSIKKLSELDEVKIKYR